MIDENWIRNSNDYLWNEGCCLVCFSKSKGCWCNKVKCHECDWYKGFTKDNKEIYGLEHLEGYCTFPSSNFSFPPNEEESIETETEKAYFIKFTNYPSFWIPKKACIIRKENDGFEWITIKGWFILLKENEYNNKKEKTEEDKAFSQLFYNMSKNDYID